jgi:hypothetical protein
MAMRVTTQDSILATALIAIAMAPFVLVPIPPMTYLPQHVLVGQILLHFDDPAFAFERSFAIDAGLRPLIVPHLFLAELQAVAGPIGGAKLDLAVFVLLTYLTSGTSCQRRGSRDPA